MQCTICNISKLMLVIFCLFEYIYFLYYHPVNLDIINMSEIIHAAQQIKWLNLNKEKQLCRYTLHQELLINNKRNRGYPKGLRLKFNLLPCSDSPELQRNSNIVLRNASLKLCGIILKRVELTLHKKCFPLSTVEYLRNLEQIETKAYLVSLELKFYAE